MSRPRLGLALGGGGIRGMAHIGLIEQLDKHGIRADMVAGTSIGACMAALRQCLHTPAAAVRLTLIRAALTLAGRSGKRQKLRRICSSAY